MPVRTKTLLMSAAMGNTNSIKNSSRDGDKYTGTDTDRSGSYISGAVTATNPMVTLPTGVISFASADVSTKVPFLYIAPCKNIPEMTHGIWHILNWESFSFHEQIIFTLSIAESNFLAVSCRRALINVIGWNKSPGNRSE